MQHLTNYDLLIVQDLWQTRFQILLISLPKKDIKFNINMDKKIRNVKEGLMECKSFCSYQNYQKRLMKT